MEESGNTFIKLSPNPVENAFSITIDDSKTFAQSIRIVDMSGREVYRRNLSGLKTQLLSLDVQQANMQRSGMYVAELAFNDGSRMTQKIIRK